MNKIIECPFCCDEEVTIKIDGKFYTTLKCMNCEKQFTLEN